MNNQTAQLLEQHFNTAFAAPGGIKKLRELILTLAMQGRLVAQDPSDPPARELLKEIEAEKRRLVKEGKIKQPKPLLEIKPEEISYGLPQGWSWVRLSEALDVRDGTHDTPKYVDAGYPLITSKNIYTGALSFDDVKFISEEDHRKIKERSKVDVGDILFAMIGSIGNPVIVDSDIEFSIKNVALFKCYQRGKPSNRYLNYFLVHAQDNMRAISSGAVQSFVSLGFLRTYLMPLPPLPEQHRIVAKIDQLMSRCDELEKLRTEREQKRLAIHTAALRQLLAAQELASSANARQFLTRHFSELYSVKESVAQLRKTILQLAVMGKLVHQDPSDPPASALLKEIEAEKLRLVKEGKIKPPKPMPKIKEKELPYVLPEGWEWVRVFDLVDVGTGSTPTKSNRDYYNGHIPWYTSSATNKLVADPPDTFITEKAIKETNCKVFPSGSLIVAMYGQGKTRGQISEIVVPGATNQAIAALIPYKSSEKIKSYLKYFFIKIYEEIRSIAEGAAQPNLNVGKIKETLVPLPPLPEQHRIVAKIDKLMALCDTLDQQIDATTGKQTELLDAVMASI
jgi:type I restriction enzyme S subunit